MLISRLFTTLKRSFVLSLLTGLCLTLLWGCFGGGGIPSVESEAEAETALLETVLPKIDQTQEFVSDAVASRYSTDAISDPLPAIEDFSLYAAQPPSDEQTVYLEIFSSSEKANVDKQNERWLVEVAEAFNQQGITTSSGQPIQVGIRKIPSGTAA